LEETMSNIGRRAFITQAATMAVAIAGGLSPTLSRLFGGSVAFAQGADSYTSKPVRFIVPLAPGGAIDFIARQVGEVLSREIGQQIVVENRTGAGARSAWMRR
jgi:tripartite-type tricarboxylate transporter receptor subunit TctC